jgi:hypothetical protein
MLYTAVVSALALNPNAPPPATTRRAALGIAATTLAAAAAPLAASAKAGQFGKIGIFGMSDISSPYVPGGPKAGPEATFGYAKSEGEFLANGYEQDVTREKAAFLESSRRIQALTPKIQSKTWWFVKDELRAQAYAMRSSMKALNKALPDGTAATKAYAKFWKEVEQFDLACTKKDLDLANKEYTEMLDALKAYTALV